MYGNHCSRILFSHRLQYTPLHSLGLWASDDLHVLQSVGNRVGEGILQSAL